MMCEYLGVSDCASKGVLDVLKSVYLAFRKVKVQRVTVVEFGMYNRRGDVVGCLEVKVGANAAQLTDVIVAVTYLESDDI